MLLFYLFLFWFPPFWTSCDIPRSSTIHLADPDSGTFIFSSEVIDSVFYTDSAFPSSYVITVSIKEQFVGTIPAKTFTLLWHTGKRPAKGEQWLVFTALYNGHYFAGETCNETIQIDSSAYVQYLLDRLRLFRNARSGSGYNPVVARQITSDTVAARGAFLSGKPFGKWVHYKTDGALWASFNFDSTGQKNGYNAYIEDSGKLTREHYIHGFKDTVWGFGDLMGRTLEDKIIYRGISDTNFEMYRMKYDTLGQMTYIDYLCLSESTGDSDSNKYRVLASSTKIFAPPVRADSTFVFDREKGLWYPLIEK